ncbi:MAG: (R)-specific enoyl-CoA hydratase [Myxococcota bacterium]|nr:(R)-specific enoyl-CoA hydratase [Myxococcota bacterium]
MSETRKWRIGDAIPYLTKTPITKTQIVMYTGASGDFNPIHWDQEFAKSGGYPGVFAHGMISAGFIAQCLTDWVGVRNFRETNLRFKRIVWPGDTLTCGGVIDGVEKGPETALLTLRVWAKNQKGEEVTSGTAKVSLPASTVE